MDVVQFGFSFYLPTTSTTSVESISAIKNVFFHKRTLKVQNHFIVYKHIK
jgi:hypothetical protein